MRCVIRASTRFLSAATLGLVLLLTAAGPASAATASVGVADFRFSPHTITIHAGDTVVWSSTGPSAHTVTADAGGFDSGSLNAGQSFSHTFPSAGTFAYHCQFHQSLGMVGTVVVLASSGGGSGSGGGGATTPPTLPNTGLSSSAVLVGFVGLGLLVLGSIVLLATRRRRT